MTSIYLVPLSGTGKCESGIQGRIDSEISEGGQRQLDRLAERFREISLDAIYTSPLRRARGQEALNRYHGLPVQADTRFIEIDGGCWEAVLGKNFPIPIRRIAITGCIPLGASRPRGRSHDFRVYPYGGGADGLSRRASRRDGGGGLPRLRYPERPVLGPGWPIERLNDVPWSDNTAVTLLRWEGKRPGSFGENDGSHLEEKPSMVETASWWRK